jgi:Tol biopolymer transport system component
MAILPAPATPDADTSPNRERLESWKEIAAYLNRSVRTLHRWEKEEGLPVHRQLHKELGSVFAYKRELDAWARNRSVLAAEGRGNDREPATPYRKRLMLPIALSGAVVLIASLSYIAARGSRREEPAQEARVASLELISTFSGSHRSPSLSPDGRMVAFVSDADGTPQVWIKNLETGDPVQLTFDDMPASRPRWTARGDRIVFSRVGHGIWSVPSLGGEPRQIVSEGRNADLSPDGRRLVFERAGEVVVAGTDGSELRVLPHPRRLQTYYGDSWPTFSPDGTSIALFVTEEGRYGDYWIVPLNGGEARRVTSDFEEGGAPAWTPDGRSLVIRSSRTGSANLWRVSVDGSALERLTSGAGDDFDPVVSPDGRMVLFANVKRTWEVILQDLHSGAQRTLLAQRTPLVLPRFSPDGRRIALAGRNSRGETHLFVMDADGSNLKEVTEGRGELNIMPQWGADGDTLYFYQVRPTQTFRSVSVSAGAARQVAPWAFAHQYQAAVDRRQRMAVYSSVEHGALQQSRARDLDTGSDTGLGFALYEQRFSRDGRLIAGESRDHELLVCELSGGCRSLTPKSERGLTAPAWSSDDTRLLFLRHTSKRVWGELTSISVDGGGEKSHGLVGPFEHDFQMFMDVSPRDEIVFARCREGAYELWGATLR